MNTPGRVNTLVNTPVNQAGHAVSIPEGASDSLVERVAQYSGVAVGIPRDAEEKTVRLTETSPWLQVLADRKSVV